MRGQRFEPTRKELHLSLLPAPYHGNIVDARVIILLMNPGFVASDYYAEENKQFRAAVMSNLSQTNGEADFPFFGLNPSFAWSGGYQWAEPKLRPFAKAIQEKLKQRDGKSSYYQALACLSKQIAIVELFPYHSSDGQAITSGMWNGLPSVKAARLYVQNLCKSPHGPLIVVARSHKRWGIPERTTGNVAHCATGRSVSFNPEVKGKTGQAGKKMLEILETF